MKDRLSILILIGFILAGCVGVSSKGLFGTGVTVALDPRTVGTQIDDSIMQKTISAKILAKDKKYFILHSLLLHTFIFFQISFRT